MNDARYESGTDIREGASLKAHLMAGASQNRKHAGEISERLDAQYQQAEALHQMSHRLQAAVERLAGSEPERSADQAIGAPGLAVPETISQRMHDVDERREVAMCRIDALLNRLEQYI